MELFDKHPRLSKLKSGDKVAGYIVNAMFMPLPYLSQKPKELPRKKRK